MRLTPVFRVTGRVLEGQTQVCVWCRFGRANGRCGLEPRQGYILQAAIYCGTSRTRLGSRRMAYIGPSLRRLYSVRYLYVPIGFPCRISPSAICLRVLNCKACRYCAFEALQSRFRRNLFTLLGTGARIRTVKGGIKSVTGDVLTVVMM